MTQPKQFDFWQDHSRRFLEMALRTDRHETPARPDAFGQRTGDCGDSVTFFLSLQTDKIAAVALRIDGCIHTNACANTVAQMAEGKTIADGWEITPETVAAYLETLPQDHFHCAELAVGAFYLALSNAREHQRNPWKKNYLSK